MGTGGRASLSWDGLLKTVGGMGMILYPAENSVMCYPGVYNVKGNDAIWCIYPHSGKTFCEWFAVNRGRGSDRYGTRHVGGEYHCSGVLYS